MNIANRFSIQLSKQKLFGLTLFVAVWSLLWYAPWQSYVQTFIWLKLGFALLIFISPGVSLFGILARQPNLSLKHLLMGFVFSHLLAALSGTIARAFQLSFGALNNAFWGAGLVFGLLFVFQIMDNGIQLDTRAFRASRLIPLVMLLLVALAACLVVLQRIIGDDDLTYLAYLTSFQHATQLDFRDVVLGTGALVHPRFWVMSTPFAQALLANLADVPGILLLGGYYEPFLVLFAVLSWYELGRTLSFSRRAASIAAMLQLVFLLLLSGYFQPGSPFFTQLSADKATAAFILAPVFFSVLVVYLKQSTKSNLWLLFLTGLSLSFMHPVIVAYSVCVSGVMVLLAGKMHRRQRVLAIVVLVSILVPQVILRFASASATVQIPYTTQDILSESGVDQMVSRWRDSQFYGFNPKILSMDVPYTAVERVPLIARGWLIVPLLAFVFLLKNIKDQQAHFLLATFLLAFLAWFPFTGWIIGYFLSAYMLERALWLFPFGLSLAFLLQALKNEFAPRLVIHSNGLLALATVFSLAVFGLYMRENNLPNHQKFITRTQRYAGLAMAGQELDQQINDTAFVIGSPQLNDLVPGLSAKAKILTYRISQPSNMSYFSDAERQMRIADTQRLFSKSLSPQKQNALLEKYHVRYLFLNSADLQLFKKFSAFYADRVEIIDVGGVFILKIKD